MEWIGASELLSSWPSTRIRRCQAWRSSSRSARLRSVSTSSCMRPAALAEAGAPHVEAAGGARERRVGGARGLPRQERREAERLGAEADEPLGGRPEQALARAVDAAAAGAGVEREHRDVDLLHHLAQERRGLERAQPLLAQRLGERVHLDERLAERVVAARRRARGTRSPPRAAPPAGSTASAAAAPRPRARRPRRRATTRRPASRASSACAAAGRCARAGRP